MKTATLKYYYLDGNDLRAALSAYLKSRAVDPVEFDKLEVTIQDSNHITITTTKNEEI